VSLATPTAFDTALLALDLELSPVPPREDGTKRPDVEWKKFQSTPATRDEVKAWFRNGRKSIGLATGYGNLECFEFDDRDLYDAFMEAADGVGLRELVNQIRTGYEEFTPGGGVHWLYRCTEIEGSVKLAERPDPANPTKRKPLIETRGRGGFVIIAPSNGTVHPSGGQYKLVLGSLGLMAQIQPDERRALFDLARTFDEIPEQETPQSTPAASRFLAKAPNGDFPAVGKRAGDDFAEKSTWGDIVKPHGWVEVFTRGEVTYWRRPGKGLGWSATSGHTRGFKVFTSSTCLMTSGTYSKFGLYAALNHGGDFAKTTQALAQQGFGTWIDDDGEEHQNPVPRNCRKNTAQSVASQSAPPVADNRPTIRISTDEKDVNDKAVAALASDPNLYRLGYVLATILQDGDAPKGVTYKDGPPPQVAPITEATLRERMAQFAKWEGIKVRGDQIEIVPAHPPMWSVSAVQSRGIWPGVRPIVGIIEAPTIREDGSILNAPGYDPATRLYLRPNIELDPIPDRPNVRDAEKARDLILDLVCDFPFKDDTHRATWFASLLTVVARPSFSGSAPLFAFDGNCPGSGKTKLADLVAIVASGRRMPRSIWPSPRYGDDEMRKRITSMALAGERFTLLDNLDSPLGGGSLDAALTADTWKDRTLGSNAMTPALPLKLIWFASGNNIQYRGDFIRRVLTCRLETPLESPEERTGFKYPELLGHVSRNRASILWAVLVILRAYHVEGRPSLVPTLGSFEEWARAIADPVMWVTGINPLAVRADLKVNDTDSRLKIALVHGWAELPGSDDGLTVAAALKLLKDDSSQLNYPTLRAALAEISERSELPSAKTIGRVLTSCKGRNLGDYMLTGNQDRKGVFSWKVAKRTTPPQNNGCAGFAGFAGSSSSDAGARPHAHTHAGARAGLETNPANPANPASEPDPYAGDDWTEYP
jgi:hypothetical protein